MMLQPAAQATLSYAQLYVLLRSLSLVDKTAGHIQSSGREG